MAHYGRVVCVVFLCFRLLLMLGEEELMKPPFSIENQAHRRAVLAELNRIKTLGIKPPQNLWEYKASNLINPLQIFRVVPSSRKILHN